MRPCRPWPAQVPSPPDGPACTMQEAVVHFPNHDSQSYSERMLVLRSARRLLLAHVSACSNRTEASLYAARAWARAVGRSVPALIDLLNALSPALLLYSLLYSATVAGLFLCGPLFHVPAHCASESRMFPAIGRSQRSFVSGLLVAASTFMSFGLTIAELSKMLSKVFVGRDVVPRLAPPSAAPHRGKVETVNLSLRGFK